MINDFGIIFFLLRAKKPYKHLASIKNTLVQTRAWFLCCHSHIVVPMGRIKSKLAYARTHDRSMVVDLPMQDIGRVQRAMENICFPSKP